MRNALKIAGATLLFGLLHSLLASRTIKSAAARVVGQRRQGAFYRLFYIVQSLLTFGALLAYAKRIPTRTVYEIQAFPATLMRLGQLAALLHALYAARSVGILRLAGVNNLRAWLRDDPLPIPPIAQGPELDQEGDLTVRGPFLWSRHPLNLSPVPLFWLTPRMTTRHLIFNLVSTLYLILGSLHEELRLRDAYGTAYAAYQNSGIPFFFPRPRR
ncbi:MAG: hypothetical protein M3220_07425 [Chloroflexota bacterium]|nr:hypothetical protein [Chloroflexota bacterium]